MKVWIDKDEWYPVYSARDEDEYGSRLAELDEDEWEEYQQVITEFEAWQNRLRDLFKKAETR